MEARPGRPSRWPARLEARVTDEQRAELERLADARNVPRNQIVRDAIRHYLACASDRVPA